MRRRNTRKAAADIHGGDVLALTGTLKLGHLQLIVALADAGMITVAAQALGISQPVASRTIAEMERQLEAKLYERHARGVRLTPLGDGLAREARPLLHRFRRIEQDFHDARSGRAGSVSIGAVTAPAVDLLPPVLAGLRRDFPTIETSLRIDSSAVLMQELTAARVDFTIARIPEEVDARLFHAETLGVEAARLVVRTGHPLMTGPPASVKTAAAFPWVMEPRGTPLRRKLQELFAAADVPPPEIFCHTTSHLLALMLAARSDAVCALSTSAALFAVGNSGAAVALLPTDFEIVVQPYSLITPRDRALTPVAQTVFDRILAEARLAKQRLRAERRAL